MTAQEGLEALLRALKPLLEAATPALRLAVMVRLTRWYCKECGRWLEGETCHCWNDE